MDDKSKKTLISHGLNLYVFRPLVILVLIIIEVLGFKFLLAGGAVKVIGLFFVCTVPILGIVFSLLALSNKLNSLSNFWKDMILYDLFYRGSLWLRLFKGVLVLVMSLIMLYFVLTIFFT